MKNLDYKNTKNRTNLFLKIYSNLTPHLGGNNNLKEAKRLLKRAYTIVKETLGEDHPTTQGIKNNLDSLKGF